MTPTSRIASSSTQRCRRRSTASNWCSTAPSTRCSANARSAASAASRSTPPPVLERASRTAQRSERNDTRQKHLVHLFVTENPLIEKYPEGRSHFFVLFRARNDESTRSTRSTRLARSEARRARGSLSLPPSPVSAEWEQTGARARVKSFIFFTMVMHHTIQEKEKSDLNEFGCARGPQCLSSDFCVFHGHAPCPCQPNLRGH